MVWAFSGSAAGAGGVVVEERFGLGDDLVLEHSAMFLVGVPRAVRRLVVEHEEEGLVLRARVEEGEAEIGDDIGGVALDREPAIGREEIRVVIDALAGQDDPAVEAGGIAAEMPLADHAGVITVRTGRASPRSAASRRSG